MKRVKNALLRINHGRQILFGSSIGKNNDGDDDEELTKPESTEDKDDEDGDDEDEEEDDDNTLASEGCSQEGDDSELSDANNNITDQDKRG